MRILGFYNKLDGWEGEKKSLIGGYNHETT